VTITVDQLTEPVNLVWRQGDTQPQAFRLLNGPDIPYDFTGQTVRATARSTLAQLIDLQVGVDDPTTGVVTISPPTGGLEPDLYDYDVEFDDGAQCATWIHGRIHVKPEISQ